MQRAQQSFFDVQNAQAARATRVANPGWGTRDGPSVVVCTCRTDDNVGMTPDDDDVSMLGSIVLKKSSSILQHLRK
jgi:hypothetical protein